MPPAAEMIVTNGRVLTMDPDRPRAEAVAITGGMIVGVGSAEDVAALKGPTTEIVDAGGGSVLPGFIESHLHLFVGAAELAHLQLAGVSGFDRLSAAIRGFAEQHPDKPVLMAQGADYTILSADEPVTRHHLDRIVPDRPFAMSAFDHHTMWANTRALEMADILHGRKLGPGNEIVMGPDGLASGELRESEAMGPVDALAGESRIRLGLATGGEPDPAPTAAERAADRAIMARGLDYAAQHGITSFHNMDGNLYQLELLDELSEDGRLPVRARVPFHFKNFMQLEALEKASYMAERYRSDFLSSGFVKLFMDGVLESWTAVMIATYGDRPDWSGEPLFEAARFAEIATEADRRNLQIAVHAIGDGAVRTVLDGYEAARRANGPRDSRHRIEHIEVTTEADIPRFAELGVLASMQPPHPPGQMGQPIEPTISRIGRDRWPLAYAWRRLRDAGARMPFASDWPVSNIDPMRGIQAAVTRKPWALGLPDQSVTLEESIAGYTVEGAYAEFAERRKGKLKAGFMGDLVVISGDVEAVPPEALATLRPVVTICGGRVSYRRP